MSNISQETYKIKTHSRKHISCHSQNLIYLLTCKNCNIQYVGKTALPLHKRINIHRKDKSRYKHMIKNFRNDCAGFLFTIQILEIFPGTGYKNNKVCPVERAKRHKREEYWMKTLRAIYPYNLNERARKKVVNYHFFSISTTKQQCTRYRNNNGFSKDHSIADFFTNIQNIIQNNIKDSFYKICIILNNLKKELLKKLGLRF